MHALEERSRHLVGGDATHPIRLRRHWRHNLSHFFFLLEPRRVMAFCLLAKCVEVGEESSPHPHTLSKQGHVIHTPSSVYRAKSWEGSISSIYAKLIKVEAPLQKRRGGLSDLLGVGDPTSFLHSHESTYAKHE